MTRAVKEEEGSDWVVLAVMCSGVDFSWGVR